MSDDTIKLLLKVIGCFILFRVMLLIMRVPLSIPLVDDVLFTLYELAYMFRDWIVQTLKAISV